MSAMVSKQVSAPVLGAIVMGAALTLAGCGDRAKLQSAADRQPGRPAAAATSVTDAIAKPAEGISPSHRYALALQFMQVGNEAQARAELTRLRSERPADRRAESLLRQIDTDPRQLYGADSFAYTLKPSDTLFSLARRYLGNPLNFYGLAKFNGLTMPADLKPGSTIQIPGRLREPAPQPTAHAPRVAGSAAPIHRSAPTAAEPVIDREQAQRLRKQGLEQMSAGSIDRAVNLLSQAASLDPRDSAIAADLARARRIQTTVRSR